MISNGIYGHGTTITRNFSNEKFMNITFTNTKISCSKFFNCVFYKCNFNESELVYVQFKNCMFKKVKFLDNNFKLVTIENSRFIKCDFSKNLDFESCLDNCSLEFSTIPLNLLRNCRTIS